jgi:hypothetical protein
MFGIDPAAVLDDMDVADMGALYNAGLRFERLRGAVWLSPLANGIGGVSAVSPASPWAYHPPPMVPVNPDEYQEPDRAGFIRVVRDL